MHPSPIAETLSPLFPSTLICIVFFSLRQAVTARPSALDRFDFHGCGTATHADHRLKVWAGLVLRSIGVVNPIVYGVVNRIESHVLCHTRRRDPATLLLQRGFVPTRSSRNGEMCRSSVSAIFFNSSFLQELILLSSLFRCRHCFCRFSKTSGLPYRVDSCIDHRMRRLTQPARSRSKPPASIGKQGWRRARRC